MRHGCASPFGRRVTDEHRLVDKVAEDEVRIAACPLVAIR
jgi:Txe/YoeB family toxin of Txe-Axe toxin-antitoxin module